MFDGNTKVDCEHHNGLYYDEACHDFESLRRLCLKIDFNYDENKVPTGI